MNNLLLVPFLLLLSLSTFSSEIRVIYVKGDAYVLEEASQRRLSSGDLIDEGESIETKKNSFLILKIGEHSKHKIDPETIVQIESLPYKFEGGEEIEQPAQIYLKVGTIMSEIFEKSDNESAIARTNSTSMGVRGTKFLVNQNDSDVLLSVEEGVVEIKNNNQADIVEANQSVVVENDKVFTAVRPYNSHFPVHNIRCRRRFKLITPRRRHNQRARFQRLGARFKMNGRVVCPALRVAKVDDDGEHLIANRALHSGWDGWRI